MFDEKEFFERTPKGLLIRAPILKITPVALADLRLYTMFCDVEVSGLGKIKTSGQEMIITDILIFPQKCSNVGTGLDENGLFDFIGSIPGEENDDDYRLWWHSHVWMLPHWSLTDNRTIERFHYADFWVSIVTNKWHQQGARVDFFNPMRIIFDDLPLSLSEPFDEKNLWFLMRKRFYDAGIEGKIRKNVRNIEEEIKQELLYHQIKKEVEEKFKKGARNNGKS
jgi:hypothetical protein